LNYFVFKGKGELENGSLTLRGDSHIKRTGMLAESFEKFSEKYQDPVLWACL